MAGRLSDSSPVVRLSAAGALSKLGLCENALPVLAEGLTEQREETVLFAAREIQNLGSKASPIIQQMKESRQRYINEDGTPTNNNHAMFIDWALKNALENCGQATN